MKKILVLILAAILMIALTACGAKETEEENSGEGSLNPWHDAATADEAADGAGVGYFTVP